MTEPQRSHIPSEEIGDDLVMRFRTVKSNVMGRVARLGPSIDAILNRHDYPASVSEALGQALALVSMLGTSLKGDDAILTLQAKSDGLISLLVADYQASGALRGYATFRDLPDGTDAEAFGDGTLAMTIDPGQGLDRYQGVVALDGQSITEAAHTYFHQSEQLPTFVRLSVARHFNADAETEADKWTWRAGGLMIQHLSRQGGVSENVHEATVDEDEEPGLLGAEDDHWQRARYLAETVEDHELLDPTLASDRLLFRLFHEEGVVAFPSQPLEDSCRCSSERVQKLIRTMAGGDLEDLTDETGKISVTCEFCSTRYVFDPEQLAKGDT